MSTETDFIILIQNQFPEDVRSFISPESKIRELKGWSSLQALIITVAIDEKYGITLTDEDIKKAVTVHDLFTIVQKKSAGNEWLR
jgi:acyl carrier protein